MKAWTLIFLATAVLLTCSAVGARETSSDGKEPCAELVIQLRAERVASGEELLVQLELANVGQKVLYVFDDTLLADAFQLREDLLWYDVSTAFYLKMADLVLSTEHIRAQPKYQRLDPGDTVKRRLSWGPRNVQERKASIHELGARVTATEYLPEGTGAAFARAFGSGPSSCTREVRIPVEWSR